MNDEENTAWLKIGIAVIFLFAGSIIGYAVWNESKRSMITLDSTSPQSGVVASLDKNQKLTLGNSTVAQADENPPASAPATQPVVSTEPYKLVLPAGWKKTDSKTAPSTCGDKKTLTTDTYKNGTETVVVYENGNPNNCGGSKIADAYIDFNYTKDGSGIKAADSGTIKICTKEENANCPKGDGVISAYIGNKNSEGYEANPINGKTYFFAVSDSTLENDLEAQIRKLVDIVEKITFK